MKITIELEIPEVTEELIKEQAERETWWLDGKTVCRYPAIKHLLDNPYNITTAILAKINDKIKEYRNCKTTVKEFNYRIPEWALPYLVNDDASGLDAIDFKLVTDFELVTLARHGKGHWNVESSEGYVSRDNDVDNIKGIVYDCTYVVIEYEEEK